MYMNREDFLKAARTLSSDHGLSIIECLKTKDWAIASDIAHDLGIHITTATKDLTSLYDCGILERRKGRRKTRPAFEYKLKSKCIRLELSLEEMDKGSWQEISSSYISFCRRLLVKSKRMGWNTLENNIARELGHGGEYPPEIIRNELWLANQAGGIAEVRLTFRNLLEKVRKIIEYNIGETATARLFEAVAREEAKANPTICAKYSLLADLGVHNDN